MLTRKRKKMKNTIFAIAIMAVMISFASCASNSSNSEAKDNPSLTVEINSFTDSKGDDQYNADLSQKRAQSVLDYLSDRGVDRSRMAAKGMGKQNPIAPNSINGKDNPKGRQANRRTEFKITADIPTKRLIFDSSKPGNIEQQSLNVENNEADVPEGGDAEYRKGGRVGQGN